jgi:hypothetical protein
MITVGLAFPPILVPTGRERNFRFGQILPKTLWPDSLRWLCVLCVFSLRLCEKNRVSRKGAKVFAKGAKDENLLNVTVAY